jgi:DNA-binding transcriptional ArsR family regulator
VDDADRLAEMFRVLGAENRLRILDLVRTRALCVNAIARRLDLTPAAASQHLRLLKRAGLVVAEKRGYYVHYQADTEALDRWRTELDKALGRE